MSTNDDKPEELSLDDTKIESLDEDVKKEFIYIKHTSKDKIWAIDYNETKKMTNLVDRIIDLPDTELYGVSIDNPIHIDGVNEEVFPFIIKYIENFKETPEKCAPDAPLKNIHISIILEGEYHLFEGIYEENDSLPVKLKKINTCIDAALYFGMRNFQMKLCAIVASLVKNMEMSELTKLVKKMEVVTNVK